MSDWIKAPSPQKVRKLCCEKKWNAWVLEHAGELRHQSESQVCVCCDRRNFNLSSNIGMKFWKVWQNHSRWSQLVRDSFTKTTTLGLIEHQLSQTSMNCRLIVYIWSGRPTVRIFIPSSAWNQQGRVVYFRSQDLIRRLSRSLRRRECHRKWWLADKILTFGSTFSVYRWTRSFVFMNK